MHQPLESNWPAERAAFQVREIWLSSEDTGAWGEELSNLLCRRCPRDARMVGPLSGRYI
jgi:hypothetical protein